VNESLRDRLRRLRRDEPSEDAPTTDAQLTTAPASLARVTESVRGPETSTSGVEAARATSPDPEGNARSAHGAPENPHGARVPPSADAVGAISSNGSHGFSARSPQVAAPANSVTSVRDLLARRAARARTVEIAYEPRPPETPRVVTLGTPERITVSGGGALARESTFTRCHAHGSRSLADGLVFDAALLALTAKDERVATLDLSRAVFLDTETTGLSGGAGTYVFLVGLGLFAADSFRVWQGFLADPRDERALLQETADRIASASAIVSFFGKSFDRHRLEDKMRMHGVKPPFASVPHLDLYWPLRRLHQGRFENCRLKTLERELAGVARADDLPGSFAPAAWFDFLGGRPHQLEGVFRHNLEDVLSLVALLPHAAAPLPVRARPS